MSNLKPLHLSWSYIRNQAEIFRKQFVKHPNKIPVPIIEIVEFDLGLEIDPKPMLKDRCDIEAFLAHDLKTIFIDQDLYMDPRQEKRLRFTFAHEVGHLVLHKNVIQNITFQNSEDWIKFRLEMKEEENLWFEKQAHEFAGRLLVPKKQLVIQIENIRDKIEMFCKMVDDGDDELKDAVSKVICDSFGVSSQVIYRRINSENIWEDLEL